MGFELLDDTFHHVRDREPPFVKDWTGKVGQKQRLPDTHKSHETTDVGKETDSISKGWRSMRRRHIHRPLEMQVLIRKVNDAYFSALSQWDPPARLLTPLNGGKR